MLTYSQWAQLNSLYDRCNDIDEPPGAHYELIAYLGSLGERPRSWQEAMKTAEQLIDEGYKQ